jgi:hypothetical protein
MEAISIQQSMSAAMLRSPHDALDPLGGKAEG